MDERTIIEWVADIFEDDPDNITPETTAEEIPAWDSLGVLNLMAGLDEEFDIQLTDEELQELRSVQDVIDVFERYGHA